MTAVQEALAKIRSDFDALVDLLDPPITADTGHVPVIGLPPGSQPSGDMVGACLIEVLQCTAHPELSSRAIWDHDWDWKTQTSALSRAQETFSWCGGGSCAVRSTYYKQDGSLGGSVVAGDPSKFPHPPHPTAPYWILPGVTVPVI